jgi:6-phosphogluconolactonase
MKTVRSIVRQIQVYATSYEVAEHVAEGFVVAATHAIATRGQFSVALAGGTTPRLLYEHIAETCAEQVDWEKVFVFWGDERFVSPDHPDSNYRMIRETLLDRVPIPASNIFPIPTNGDADGAAAQYEETLLTFFGNRPLATFDWLLLGMGDDGHTASLFPNSSALQVHDKWVVAHYVDKSKGWRLTLTPSILNLARQVVVMVTGKSKATRLEEVLSGTYDPQRLPIQSIVPVHDDITWVMDRAASGALR